MKLVFISNFMNHHQKSLCDFLYKNLGESFAFISTEVLPDERKNMGYSEYKDECPYVLIAFGNKNEYERAVKLANESDVVIIGDASDDFIQTRLNAGKLTFRYCERYFKQGKWRIFDPRVLKARYQHDIRYRNHNLHMLCASAYTASDCRFIHAYPNKLYRWGYFPEVRYYDNVEKVIDSKQSSSILWVGRLLKWKHPDKAVLLADRLRREGYTFNLTIIGEGEEKKHLQKLIQSKQLEDCVRLYGFVPPVQVREWMEKADIYLFTSDRNEGWGAVLNEAMNAACAVVACNEIGSVPYLIDDGVNGLKYNHKKRDDIFLKVSRLLTDEKLKNHIQRNAYETMVDVWNADVAAERLLHLIDCIQEGKEAEFTAGPCSRDSNG